MRGRSDWKVSIENSLFRENVGDGVFVQLDEQDEPLALRGVQDKPAVSGSRFIANGPGSDRATILAATVTDSYFAENRGRGVLSQVEELRGSSFERNDTSQFVIETAALDTDGDVETLEHVTVEDTRIMESDSRDTIRVTGLCSADDLPASAVRVESSEINGNSGRYGIGIIGDDCSSVELMNSVVTGVRRDAVTADYVTLVNTSVVDNTAFGVRGVLNVRDSTIARNKFGGLYAFGASAIVNSTISENRALAIVATSDSQLTLNGVTIFGNVLNHNFPAVRNAAVVHNSVIAHNMTPEGVHFDLTLLDDAEVSHSLVGVNRGNNLEEARPGSPDAAGNFVGTAEAPVDAQIGVLADGGEGVLTHAVSPNSPILDAGDAESSPEFDQLGRERGTGAGPEMRAIEFDPEQRSTPELRMFLESRGEEEGSMELYIGLSDLPMLGETVTVDLTTQGVGAYPATPDVDYVLETASVVFDSNSPTVQVVPITLIDDEIGEQPQKFRVDASVTGDVGSVQKREAAHIYSEDVVTIVVTGNDAKAEGSGRFRVLLQPDKDSEIPITVTAQTRHQTTSEDDFTPVDTEFTLTGDKEQIFELEIPITSDALVEFDERLTIGFEEDVRFVDIRPGFRTLTIIDDDPVGLIGSILKVRGTGTADVLHVTDSEDTLAVRFNGTDYEFGLREVSRLIIETDAGNDTITLDTTVPAMVTAGAGNDTVLGGSDDDTINGGDGDDSLNGRAGNDYLDGKQGNDHISGATGRDFLLGDDGNDSLFGGPGNDTLRAGDGNDYLSGSSGRDQLDGSRGDDDLFGGTSDDILDGGSDHDVLHGGEGNDDLRGAEGRDLLFAGLGADTLNGNAGSDLLNASRLGQISDSTLASLRIAWQSDADYAQRVSDTRVVFEANADVSSAWKNADSVADVFRTDLAIDWLHADSETDTFGLDSGELHEELG